MTNKSAIEALGLEPDFMRSIWNGMTERDRRFLCKLAFVFDESFINTDKKISIHHSSKTWDELSKVNQISIREGARRLTGWAQKIGLVSILETMKAAA